MRFPFSFGLDHEATPGPVYRAPWGWILWHDGAGRWNVTRDTITPPAAPSAYSLEGICGLKGFRPHDLQPIPEDEARRSRYGVTLAADPARPWFPDHKESRR